jgi:hypothetical protein
MFQFADWLHVGTDPERSWAAPHSQMLRQIHRVVKFWREYIGNQSIESIGNKELSGYIEWRKSYYAQFKTLPNNAKLNPADKKHCSAKRHSANQSSFGHTSRAIAAPDPISSDPLKMAAPLGFVRT